MKSQDIFLLLKLVTLNTYLNPSLALEGTASLDEHTENDMYKHHSVRELARVTGIGKSEVSNALSRCYFSGLCKPNQRNRPPYVNTKALLEFLVYGIRYVFPVKPKEITRGIATCLTAPIFGRTLHMPEQCPVWSYAKGDDTGPSIEPLYKSVPMTVLQDPVLYEMLATVDSIRLGAPRERNLAVQKLEDLLRG